MTVKPWVIAFLTGLGFLSPSATAHAQWDVWAHAEGLAAVPRVEQRTAVGSTRLTGTAFGLRGGLGMGLISLDLEYSQGSVRAEGAASTTTLVQGGAFLTAQPISFGQISVGGRARAFVTDAGTETWHMWQVGIRAETQLMPQVQSYLEASYGFAGGVNSGVSLANARGVSGGLVFHPARFPLWLGVAYSADRSALAGGTRVDVVEEFSLTVGVGRR